MNAWWRLLGLVLATAVVINIAWMLIRPAIPLIAGLIVLALVFEFVRWHRRRW